MNRRLISDGANHRPGILRGRLREDVKGEEALLELAAKQTK